ncbi:DUF5916 domain-containing protein [Flavobacterium sp.]|uniref:DUF5916 domain-containing protein n=1 Tax=Flavobacterium sp. TaxID=239 RepID=UPI00260C7A0C|nr:DUF5916 domain-containing protein [Flavobacterium sp.]MDD3004867.1 DUF5916 domain-containing protein [Flavobacterium sp.]
MPIRQIVLFFFIITSSQSIYSQQKTLRATFTNDKISIDGKVDEDSWKTSETATDFIMFEPDNGAQIAPEKKSTIRITYDNEAIYVSAVLNDENPSGILKEITQRDLFGTADHFGVYINGFNDGQQDFRFFVSAAGVQLDCIATEGSEDYSWDAIWNSQVEITNEGWNVEMKIPYAALRFSKEKIQTWGINFYREIKRDRQKYTWNPVSLNVGALLPQTGRLEGIENIQPPTRLFFIPYSSYYFENNSTTSSHTFKAGMDVKYGINDSFTLDAILVPDFGQTVYDNVELNLGPFEQQFNENRPFFTEGTDLFNKGGLLYSRRIGGNPSVYAYSDDENITIKNPTSVNLLNAFKVSGRTKSGLGLGILNAITERTFAQSYNQTTQKTSKIEVEPLTNYNVLVVDQRFNQNSSVSFVNTNVTRNGTFRDANVSALVYNLNTKNNRYNLSGDFKYSFINSYGAIADTEGISTTLGLGKKGGKWRYNAGFNYVSEDYDPNDLGINFITNYHGGYGNLAYRILNPTKIFNTFRINYNNYLEIQNTSGRLQQAQFNIDITANTIKNDYIALALYVNPIKVYDFYEARLENRFVTLPENVYSSLYLSTNYNRKFALDFTPYATLYNETDRMTYGVTIIPRYRFSNRFLMTYSLDMFRQNSDRGYAGIDEANEVVFSERDRRTITNELSAKYAINPKMTLNLATRYYWATSEKRAYFSLSNDGTLVENNVYAKNTDINYNTLNFDFSYSWWFAPGSQISVLYRNNGTYRTNLVNRNIAPNFKNLIDSNLNTIFSVSIRYFIDYNSLKNSF